MGVLKRFTDIMSANINALLDKAEDPEKMIDQCLRDLESDLVKVKKETASVMAEESRTKRQLDECNAEMDKLQQYAEKALLAGNEGDARKFLEEKARLTSKQATFQQAYDLASANSIKMRQMHDKLVRDISDLNSRKAQIKAKVQMAKAQERMNKMSSSIGDTSGSMAAFNRMEAKADAMLDRANAETILNQGSTDPDDISKLSAKYDAVASPSVEDELAALKSSLGM
ncbi:MAG: PspA/IM30 family protein [Eubacteriales bacterium]|nr:PspA/IM30 family protein [Eubacteriales bacterium]